jgi:hypothetical protein
MSMANVVDAALDGRLRPELEREIHLLRRFVDSTLNTPVLPLPGETAAVAVINDKTAALFYDRVWTGLGGRVPEDIGFRGASDFERIALLVASITNILRGMAPGDPAVEEVVKDLRKLYRDPTDRQDFRVYVTRRLVESLAARHAVAAVPVFPSEVARDREYAEGDYEVLVAAIADIPIPVEERLTWEQVREFRGDDQAKLGVRRLKHWLDSEMVGKSWKFVGDELALRLDQYERALDKHGSETVLGSLSTALDSKVIVAGSAAATSVAFAGQPTWGLVAGGAVLVAKAAVHVAKSLLDLRNARWRINPEVAFVAELKSSASKGNTA